MEFSTVNIEVIAKLSYGVPTPKAPKVYLG